MNNFLTIVTLLAAAGSVALIAAMPVEGGPAAMLILPLAAAGGLTVSKIKQDDKFLLKLFIAAILVRVFLGSMIYYFHQTTYFAGDAETFDILGNALVKTWDGDIGNRFYVDQFMRGGSASGWGMIYVVAG